MIDTARVHDIESHARAFFAGHAADVRVWSRSRGMRVLAIAPGPRTGLWTYASMAGRDRDFVLLAPTDEDLHVELVTMVASYHALSSADQPKAGPAHDARCSRVGTPTDLFVGQGRPALGEG